MDLDALPWNITKASNDEGIVIFRQRVFPDDFPKHAFPHRLNIFWQMTEASSNGLPEDSESDRMGTFEDRLIEATEPDVQSVLSLVLTGKGQREFVFHTQDPKEFLRRLTEMPQEEAPYPIEIHRTDDSTWEYVDRVLGDIDRNVDRN